jgi:hypothetical protein
MATVVLTKEYTIIDQADFYGFDTEDWNINDGTAEVTLESIYTGYFDETSTNVVSNILFFANPGVDSTRSEYILKVEVGVTASADLPSTTDEEFSGRIITFDFDTLFYIDSTSNTTWFDITNVYGSNIWTWENLSEYTPSFFALNYAEDSTASWNVIVEGCSLRITYSDLPPGNFGLQCWDSSGLIILDTNDRITRVLFSTVAAADTSGSDTFEMPDGGSYRIYAFSIPINATGENRAHNVSVSNNTVSWTPVSLTDKVAGDVVTIYDSCDSLIVVVGW